MNEYDLSDAVTETVAGALTGNELQTLGVKSRKAQDPNVKLWHGTER